MGHLVADTIGGPAERQFRKVTRAEDQRTVQIGKTEEIIRPQAGLHVLERDVVDFFRHCCKDGRCWSASVARSR